MAETMVNNSRLARNTMWLYLRQIVMMLVALYTSRIELQALGIEGYGIYTVVGGIVLLFAFLNNAMTAAIQRALNYEMGCEQPARLRATFNAAIRAQLLISLVLVVVAETVGLWYMQSPYIHIPAGRENAAMWVYQLSVLACIAQVMRVPYNAMVVAQEKMNFFAYLSIVEAVLKLGLVAMLLWLTGTDTLILYAALIVVLNVVVFVINKWYCNRHWKASRLQRGCDKPIFKQILGFSGWTLLGSAADVGAVQGLNLVLNAVGAGVVANAAAGVATKVSGMVYQFVSNFQTAFRPQIVKSYAAQQLNDFFTLLNRTAKISYFLLWFFALPLILNMDFVLHLWLKEVPPFAVEFCGWTLGYLLIDALSAPLWMASQAQGRIRNYQIMVSVLLLSNLPLAYFMLKAGLPQWSVFASKFGINVVTLFARMIYLKHAIALSPARFMREALMPVVVVTLLTTPLPLWVMHATEAGWLQLLATTALSVLVMVPAIYYAGLSAVERSALIARLKKRQKQ